MERQDAPRQHRPIADVTPGGIAVSVLSVTDQNMPFLFESVMGEVTSTYRDLFMAVHPILVMEKGKAPATYSADHPSDPANRVSHIQLHLAPLNSAQSPPISSNASKKSSNRSACRFPTGSRCFPRSTQ